MTKKPALKNQPPKKMPPLPRKKIRKPFRIDENDNNLGSAIDEMQSRLRAYEVLLHYYRNDLVSTNVKVLISTLESKLAELTWEISTGTNMSEMKTHRSIPVRVYLSHANISLGDNVLNAIFDALSEIGIARSIELPGEFGSLWKMAWGITKEALTQDEVLERLEKLEHAAQLKIIDKPQSEITKAHAEAASKMIKSLDGVPTASVQIGNLLIVKTSQKRGDAKVVIRTLTASELIAIEKNKSILKTPTKVIDMLDHECLGHQVADPP